MSRVSVARYYITAAVAVLLSFLLPFNTTGGVIAFVLILAGVFALSSFIRVKAGGLEDLSRSTGDRTLDAVLEQGFMAVSRLRMYNNAIADAATSAQLERLERLATDIFTYLRDHPDKLRMLRAFMDYTLPTTISLMESRQELIKGGVDTAQATVARIDGMLGSISDAFADTLDRLYADKALDTEAEIDVLAGKLKADGLDDPFNLNKGAKP